MQFKFTLEWIEEWGIRGRALITFPTYYASNIGEEILCSLHDSKLQLITSLYCEMEYDWTLSLYGPREYILKFKEEHIITISGVTMNNPTLQTKQ